MPSPIPLTSDASPNGVALPTPTSNGTHDSSTSDAQLPQEPFENGAVPQSPAAEKSHDELIEERKLKAQAVMAAAGLSVEHSRPEPVTEPIIVSAEPNAYVNGPVQSRKRSRSGTRIQQIPRAHSQVLPQRPREEEIKRGNAVKLEQYVQREMLHLALVSRQKRQQDTMIMEKKKEIDWYKEHHAERINHPGAFFGQGYAGYGNGTTDAKQRGHPRIVYPQQRKRPGGRKTKDLRILRKDRATQAEQLDELVPIRLDIEWDKVRLRDTFTWNIHDRVVPVELFAEKMIEDFQLPLEQCVPLIQQVCASMHEQIHDFHPHVFIADEPIDPTLPYHAYKNDEMRILIKLNITIGQHTLVDQFEWEINNPMNVAEEFAQQMARDLSLSGEFTTAIAHSIREQCQLFTKSLYVTGHPFDGRPIEDQELQSSFLPSPIPSPFRPHQAAKDYTPYMYELNETELEKTELSLSREERRQKRSVNRRGGPVLPDLKDRRRTIRTLVVSSVLPGAAEVIEESRIFKRTAVASGKARRPGVGQKDGIDDSDDSESDDSSPDSTANQSHLLAGTARTRGMRGAALGAQAAMRATMRSATPESSILHHHETRTSGRRVGRDYREDSSVDPPTTLIVKLKIPRHKFQQFLRDQRARTKEESLQPQAATSRPSTQRSPSAQSGVGATVTGSMGPPSLTPRMQMQNLPVPTPTSGVETQQPTTPTPAGQGDQQLPSAAQLGRIDAKGPPGPEHPMPPPPEYLIEALESLRQKYPHDLFEGTMRYTAVSTETDQPISIRPDSPVPPNTKFCYYPRIKCKDCPGKLYTPGPLMGVDNFEVHLKNRVHREKVAQRRAGIAPTTTG